MIINIGSLQSYFLAYHKQAVALTFLPRQTKNKHIGGIGDHYNVM